jgi:hypothetical protein
MTVKVDTGDNERRVNRLVDALEKLAFQFDQPKEDFTFSPGCLLTFKRRRCSGGLRIRAMNHFSMFPALPLEAKDICGIFV